MCDTCQTKVSRAVKKTIISELPETLLITVNRFEYDTVQK